MNWFRILLVGFFVLLYLRSPIDLIPDFFGPFGLLDDLVVLVLFIGWVRRQRDAATARPGHQRAARGADESRDRWDPYAVLGVPRSASQRDVTHAYREQLKRYHPDRVADLGSELQEVAHRKTIEIQQAYAEISGDGIRR